MINYNILQYVAIPFTLENNSVMFNYTDLYNLCNINFYQYLYDFEVAPTMQNKMTVFDHSLPHLYVNYIIVKFSHKCYYLFTNLDLIHN